MYDQQAGNATLYVDGHTTTSQTSIPHGGLSHTANDFPDRALVSGSNSLNDFGTALRIGAGDAVKDATDGTTGIIGIVDEAFVYGTALTVDELDYLFQAAQVRRKVRLKLSDNLNISFSLIA